VMASAPAAISFGKFMFRIPCVLGDRKDYGEVGR
jgi:hypothetical protein